MGEESKGLFFSEKKVSTTEDDYYWTREKIYKLIELYKSQDCLYNISNSSYRDKRKRNAAWKAIATGMGSDVLSVERKMKVLKTQFMHYYKLNKKYSINGGSYQPKWFAYNSLKFLISAKMHRENRELLRMEEMCHVIKVETVDTTSEENYATNDHEQQQSTQDTSLGNTLAISNLHSTNDSHRTSEARIPSTHRNEDSSNNRSQYFTERDEYAIFGELVACRLRKIHDHGSRLTVQFNINNLLFDAEMQQIDRLNTGA